MNLKFAIVVLLTVSFMLLSATAPVYCERTLSLTVCQELVNSARSYEARSTYHNQAAKAYMAQIQSFAKQPTNQNTSAVMDNLFTQYRRATGVGTQVSGSLSPGVRRSQQVHEIGPMIGNRPAWTHKRQPVT